ncbi:uncharacterized protein B0P05DRAFT_368839 [Gilbertella persicaria]|uniref:uncharacterized protein n=1 Tax=Gilbertella persicaria TaxID=101096 RepID=UPI00221E7A6D|nr:uncharacterized protein B0P05DRAFT_368839 [Gilbertella persicaria]KAI8087619.1 hypothetical protein B0P05DRAFT_368839 [Gilbertella persicaria]
MRQNEFYKQPWMREAVFHYLATKVNKKKRMSQFFLNISSRHNNACKNYLPTCNKQSILSNISALKISACSLSFFGIVYFFCFCLT